jgi:hypothetical protein
VEAPGDAEQGDERAVRRRHELGAEFEQSAGLASGLMICTRWPATCSRQSSASALGCIVERQPVAFGLQHRRSDIP